MFPIRVRQAIHGGLLVDRQPEHIEVSVFPPHHHLKYFMEGMKADGPRYDYFPPDRRLDTNQLDVQVIAAL